MPTGRRARGHRGGRWKSLILYFLAPEGLRYGALRRRPPHFSDKMLIQQPEKLQADGFVERTESHGGAPKWTMLSLFGMSLAQSLAPPWGWGEAHRTAPARAKQRFH